MRLALDILLTITITIIADLIGCFLIILALILIGDEDVIYTFFGTLINSFVPTFFVVMLFRFVKSVTYQINSFISLLRQSVILIAVSLLGLIIWAIADIVSTSGLESSLLYQIKQDFTYEFLGYVPATIAIAFVIPFIDKWLGEKSKQPS